MTTEPQPELRWAPIPPKPSNRGRVWLIVGLVIATLLIAGIVALFLIPRDDEPRPGGTASSSATPSSSPTSTPTASASPTPTPPVETPPVPTPPPVVDPDVEEFRGQVAPRLDDALTGLDIIAESGGQDGLAVLETLEQDAQRLADTPPPSSIASAWNDGVSSYSARLAEVRQALTSGADLTGALSAARDSATALRALVGL